MIGKYFKLTDNKNVAASWVDVGSRNCIKI
jgi:hypothetical protein